MYFFFFSEGVGGGGANKAFGYLNVIVCFVGFFFSADYGNIILLGFENPGLNLGRN